MLDSTVVKFTTKIGKTFILQKIRYPLVLEDEVGEQHKDVALQDSEEESEDFPILDEWPDCHTFQLLWMYLSFQRCSASY